MQQQFQRFSDFIFSRQTLVFVGVLLLALTLWFIGPLFAVGGLRPFASVGVRVTFIVLVLVLGILWIASGPISLVGVAAICLLVWHAGPLLSLGSAQPLLPVWIRTAIIAVILSICALYWLYRFWNALRHDENLRAKVLDFGKGGADDDTAKVELKTVADAVQKAMGKLRSLRSRGGTFRRIFEGKRYLYELPWYMIVGNSNAGKTTALLNSGLQFPVDREKVAMTRRLALESKGGTMHCDWWFTNEAVLIDTAGRYVEQASGTANDPLEWKGFLGILRKYRTRAPINGVIVALDASDLASFDDVQRAAHAGKVSERLAELRQELGIRFPVYVVVTKMDLLRGFPEYFHALTSERRMQAWGFTLPYQARPGRKGRTAADVAAGRAALRAQVGTELALLRERIEAGLRSRLSEEFDVDRRRRLFALPEEFEGLSRPLMRMVDEIFLDSRFDGTQLHNTLRGVYFTSSLQTGKDVAADRHTVLQRLWRSLHPDTVAEAGKTEPADAASGDATARGQQGFFLQDVLTKVIIPEAHLVRPNLRWELRFRLLRLLGHALAVVVFAWLAGALALSFDHNKQYLQTVGARAQALSASVRALFANFKPAGVPDVLNGARELPAYAGLDVDHPSSDYLYGLYAVPPVLQAATESYAQLQDHMLLPPIVLRMEAVLVQSLKAQDAKTAYETLRVYKLLHDKVRYMSEDGARDVRQWVLKDWERSDSAAVFGGRASMVGHVERLFSGTRPVQSAVLPNKALVRETQDFLDGNTSTQRVYERAKMAMLPETPQDFTLVRAVGPQAGTVFSRAGGLPLEKGVPGLFTYDGYHEVFNKRLPEFVARALQDDAWVMGRTTSAAPSGFARDQEKVLDDAAAMADRVRDNPLLEDIRRQYLTEYAQHWEDFLDSIRTVGGGDVSGTSLGFDLSVLRQFAAPDSPLTRLARAAARETTLSRPLLTRTQEEKSFLDKATDALDKQTRELGKNLGIRREERLEKQLVDNRFAALREVVTGQPDMALAGTPAGAAAKPGLEAISGLVNEFYTLLVVADTALTAGSLPPGGAEVGARLKLEAGKLPAPFREVLTALATSGGDKVVQGSADILRKQAQLQLDRIMGLMAMQVSEPCKRGVEGRYPLAAVAQDASIEDFTLMFAAGGAADEFFTRYLLPFVDTSVRPWRYKSPDTANAMVGGENIASGVPPAPVSAGPTLLGEMLKLLARQGPNLDTFYRAQQIRDLFFRDAGGKKLAWKMEMKVLDLEPSITDLVLDIDGQGQRYIHGPVQAFTVNWPGPRGGSMAELVANPRISGATSTVMVNGPWALFRLLDRGRIVNGATAGRTSVEFSFDGRKALLDISAGTQPNPLNSDVLKGFRCPGRSS